MNYGIYGVTPTGGFAITGGADAAQFTIDNATGDLSLIAAPSYAAPPDLLSATRSPHTFVSKMASCPHGTVSPMS